MDITLQRNIEKIFGGEVFQTAWDCDIISSLSDHINAHNKFRQESGQSIEAKFSNLVKKTTSLEEVMKSDFNFLKKDISVLTKLENGFVFVEIYGASPNAHSFELEHNGRYLKVVALKTPLIYFIHSFFSKAYMLMHDSQLCDCLPEHEKIMESEEYSDLNLLAGIYKDIDIFFEKGKITNPINPFHLAFPYDYCEMVEGARRFVLAHELGHFIRNPSFIAQALNSTQEKMSEEWLIEIQCDFVALKMIFEKYSPTTLTEVEFYELANSLKGILMFFFALDIVETAFDVYYNNGFVKHKELRADTSHPPASVRVNAIYQLIQNQAIYKSNTALQQQIVWFCRRLNSFRRALSGLFPNIPSFFMKFGDDEFARQVYNRLFYKFTSEGDLLPDLLSEKSQEFKNAQ